MSIQLYWVLIHGGNFFIFHFFFCFKADLKRYKQSETAAIFFILLNLYLKRIGLLVKFQNDTYVIWLQYKAKYFPRSTTWYRQDKILSYYVLQAKGTGKIRLKFQLIVNFRSRGANGSASAS